MTQILGMTSCSVCFAANTYIASHTRTPWLRTAALATGALCLLGMCLSALVLTMEW